MAANNNNTLAQMQAAVALKNETNNNNILAQMQAAVALKNETNKTTLTMAHGNQDNHTKMQCISQVIPEVLDDLNWLLNTLKKYSETVVVHHKQSPLSAYVNTNMAEEKEDRNKLYFIQLPEEKCKKNADLWTSAQHGIVTAPKAMLTYEKSKQAKLVKHKEARTKEYEKVKIFKTSHSTSHAVKMLLLQFQAQKSKDLIDISNEEESEEDEDEDSINVKYAKYSK